jgi:hypothetical protein
MRTRTGWPENYALDLKDDADAKQLWVELGADFNEACVGLRTVLQGLVSQATTTHHGTNMRYVVVSATTGSTRVVRSAGTIAAANAIAPKATIVPTKIFGS